MAGSGEPRLSCAPPNPSWVHGVVATAVVEAVWVILMGLTGVTGPLGHGREVVEAFWWLWAAGLPMLQAGEQLGVDRRTINRWVHGCGGVRPRPRPAPSGRYLSAEERETIALGKAAKLSAASIARQLGRSRSTVTRELKRNCAYGRAGMYRAGNAQRQAHARARRPKPAKLLVNTELRAFVADRLRSRQWSPEQISHALVEAFPDRAEMRVSHETIYQSLYVQSRGALKRELTVCLRTGRAVRRAKKRPEERRGRIPGMINISERPAEVQDRAVPGHWEGDLIIGKDSGSAIGTLVERSTRFVMLLHLPQRHGAQEVEQAMLAAIAAMPERLRGSLTWDQGKEMSNHATITLASGLDIYFCDPHSPWQRGSNENTNGLLRQYFPKGTDLSVHSADYLTEIADRLNDRPRKTLGWKSPRRALNELLVATTD